MTPSIAAFREQVRAILANEPTPRRHVIVLGVDGIPFELACRTWRQARVTRARSVFPTTSSTAWLTSLTGESVDAHGIPGVVFTVADHGLVDVYAFQGSLGDAPPEDLFSDAARGGYTPVAILGDLETTHCTWRDWLVQRAHQVHGHELFARLDGALDAQLLGDRLVAAVEHALTSHPAPCFLWCFIDADRYIHYHGYDPPLIEFLERVDTIAAGWARRDAVVIAHSDHGLVPTRHDPAVAEVIDRVMAAEACQMGGAGRTRWLYVEPGAVPRVRDELARCLPPSIQIYRAEDLFAPGSLARRRVGSIVLVAHGEDFLAADGYRFEHGSLTDQELDVPVAEWRAC
jgi:hypothetical protein